MCVYLRIQVHINSSDNLCNMHVHKSCLKMVFISRLVQPTYRAFILSDATGGDGVGE